MPLQFRRGTDTERLNIVPASGEPIWTTDNNELYIGDGSTVGGILVGGGGGTNPFDQALFTTSTPTFSSITINDTANIGKINLSANPVGQTYLNTSSSPAYYIGGPTQGDNDPWKIYGESPATDRTSLVFEVGDNLNDNENIKFRFKKTFGGSTATDQMTVFNDRVEIKDSLVVGSNLTLNSDKIRLGSNAGTTAQGTRAIAIGQSAGNLNQNSDSIAIGTEAGAYGIGFNNIAIGLQAMQTSTFNNIVGIGVGAARNNPGAESIHIGTAAGGQNAGAFSISIGNQSGNFNQGHNSIAIGTVAGYTDQAPNSIILNAQSTTSTGVILNAATEGFFVAPIRQSSASTSNILYYNTSNREITYNVATTITVTTVVTDSVSLVDGQTSSIGLTGQTGTVTIDSWSTSTYRSAKYVISVDDGTDIHLVEMLTGHAGGNTFKNEYGLVLSNDELVTFDTDINSGNFRLKATSTGTFNVKVVRTIINI